MTVFKNSVTGTWDAIETSGPFKGSPAAVFASESKAREFQDEMARIDLETALLLSLADVNERKRCGR